MNQPRSATLPPELDAALRRELDEGERVLWTGQPIPALMRRRARGPSIGFGLLACALGCMLIAGGISIALETEEVLRLVGDGQYAPQRRSLANGVGGLIFFSLFGLALIAGGCVFFLQPRAAYRRAQRTAYAVTDRRAIMMVVHLRGGGEEHDYRPDELLHLGRRENADGSGDLVFETAVRQRTGGSRQGISPHGFLGIAEVQEVERLLRRTFSGS